MGPKVRKILLSTLLGALAAGLVATPAVAQRDTPDYVPPQYDDDPGDPGFEFQPPFEDPDVAPKVVPVVFPEVFSEVVTDPGAGPSGGGETGQSAPATDPAAMSDGTAAPEAQSAGGSVRGGILSRTGSEAMPLVRVGLAAIALGGGLVFLGRRRRAGVISA